MTPQIYVRNDVNRVIKSIYVAIFPRVILYNFLVFWLIMVVWGHGVGSYIGILSGGFQLMSLGPVVWAFWVFGLGLSI